MHLSIGFFFSISAFFTLLVLLILFFTKKRVKNHETVIYKKLLILTIFGIIMEICMALWFCGIMNTETIWCKLAAKLNISYYSLWCLLFSCYLVCIFSDNIGESFNKKTNLFVIFTLLTTLVLPIEFVKVGEVTMPSGLSLIFTYVFVIIISIFDIFLCVKNRKKIKTFGAKFVPVYILICMGFFIFIIAVLFPELVLVGYMFALLTIIMFHTIENPDVKMIEQLELARDAADKANAAKTDFLSSMSHEIRTPLNAIVGFSDCIKNSDSIVEAKENADDIISASNTLLEIVNGILDISKIEAGMLEIIEANYNANNLFYGLAKLMSPKMQEKGIDFQVSIADDLPKMLYGDSTNVKKVVTNLLSNAYKYTDRGFVKYDVKGVKTNDVCRLIVTVSDSGRGIKKESLDKLFTKFQRVDEDRNTAIEGTGLGLAITKQLVELMGGTISVNSTFGEGSTFVITLDQKIESIEQEEDEILIAEDIDLIGKKILVVDDNIINLKVAKKILERYNATVEVCDSGFKCLELVAAGNIFDLILMDDMMPQMSGIQTLHKLKENAAFKTPVFALTANAITGMREMYLEEGFDSYLAKPIEKEAMILEFNKLFFNNKAVSVNSAPVIEASVTPAPATTVENTVSIEVPVNNVDSTPATVVETSKEVNVVAVATPVTKVEDNGNFVKNVDYLKNNNIDIDHSLELLGDMDLFDETMNDFVSEIPKKLPLLAESKANSNMESYAILVHAIKSDCKYLGIMPLAEIAYEHELKSKANDVQFVNDNYDALLVEINKYLDICKKYMGRD